LLDEGVTTTVKYHQRAEVQEDVKEGFNQAENHVDPLEKVVAYEDGRKDSGDIETNYKWTEDVKTDNRSMPTGNGRGPGGVRSGTNLAFIQAAFLGHEDLGN
jgi:hypothetical protein